jgi:hypothetical protein
MDAIHSTNRTDRQKEGDDGVMDTGWEEGAGDGVAGGSVCGCVVWEEKWRRGWEGIACVCVSDRETNRAQNWGFRVLVDIATRPTIHLARGTVGYGETKLHTAGYQRRGQSVPFFRSKIQRT